MEQSRLQTLRFLGMREDDLLNVNPANAQRIVDMERDPQGVWRTMPGTVQVGTWLAGAGSIVNLTWFEQRTGKRWLVAEQALSSTTTGLVYYDWSSGGIISIAVRRRVAGPWAPAQLLQYGQWLYHVSGLEQPIRWDGNYLTPTVSPVGFVSPTAPPRILPFGGGYCDVDVAGGFAAAGTAWANTVFASEDFQRGIGEVPVAGATAPFRYGYCTTEVNDLGQESPPSAVVWISGENLPDIVLAPPNEGKHLPHLRLSRSGSHILGKRLWRTINVFGLPPEAIAGVRLQLHSEWPYGGEMDLIDNVPDAELGLALDPDASGYFPQGARAASFWHGTMFVAVGSRLYFSAPGLPEQFPVVNYRDVGSSATGEIVATVPIPAGLVVLKRHGIYLLKGSSAADFRVEVLSEKIGCAAPRAVTPVDGLGLVFLSDVGPYVLRGILEQEQVTRLDPLPGIRKSWRELILGTRLETAWVLHRPEFEEVWFHLPVGGGVKPTTGFVLHYGDLGGPTWSLRNAWSFASATTYQGRTFLGSHDDGSNAKAGVHILTRGSTTKLGTAVSGVYTTGFIGIPGRRTSVQRLELRVVATGTGDTIQVDARPDRQDSYASLSSVNPAQKLAEEDRDTWGTALWGAAYVWTAYEPTAVVVSTYADQGFEHGYKFTGAALRLLALDVALDDGGGGFNLPRLERR